MSQRFSQVIIAILSISILLMALISNGLVWKTPSYKVIPVQSAVIMNDQQKINLFIDELMTPKKAACLKWILVKESHTNPKAHNPHSTAKGVGQLLDSTYANLGLKHSADPLAQVIATIAYISRHYGSEGSCSAKAFWIRHSYY